MHFVGAIIQHTGTLIIGGNRNHLRSFRKYLNSIPGMYEIKELQETAILGTAHTLGKVQNSQHGR